MQRQLRLSVACGATFLAALLGLPLLNYFFPELMATRVFGFTVAAGVDEEAGATGGW